MIYADFSYYKDTYCGEMAEGDFKRLSRSASAYLDSVTFDRIAAVTDEKIKEKVREACCAVADVLLRKEQTAFLLPTQPRAVRTNNGFIARRCCISAIRGCCIGGWSDACVYGNDYAYPTAV